MDCHFIVASYKHSGSTNDIIAWQHMDLYEALEIDNQLSMKYFFICDEAFTNKTSFLVHSLVSIFFTFFAYLHVVSS